MGRVKVHGHARIFQSIAKPKRTSTLDDTIGQKLADNRVGDHGPYLHILRAGSIYPLNGSVEIRLTVGLFGHDEFPS